MQRIDEWICVEDYRHFFERVHLKSAGLEDVERLVRTGDWQPAFAAYREVLFARLERLDVAPLDARSTEPIAAADELLKNRISLLGTDLVDVGSPIDWFATPGGDKQWQSHLGYLYFPKCLVAAYRESRNRVYIEKWMSILNDFYKNHPIGVEGLEWTRVEPMYRNELAYGSGGEGRFPDYAGGSWIGLSCGRVLLWLSSLRDLGNDPALTDAFLANLLISIMRDHATTMLNNPRRYTPNQFFHVALTLASIGVILPEFDVSPACYLVGIERLETSMTTTALEDGSDMEQSFNYNSGLPIRFYELYRLYEDDPTPRVAKLLEVVHRRCRFLASLTTPLGTWPAIAKTHSTDVSDMLSEWAELFDLGDVAAIADGTTLKADASLPDGAIAPLAKVAAGSVAFPYGGYYVFRSGYARDDVYMLFKASRLAIGHMHEDCNALVVLAYGRRLLIDSGNYNYADDQDSRKINRYFFSSMAHNTLTVDELSQGRLPLQGDDAAGELSAPIDTRWHASDSMSFVEGVYTEGYIPPAGPGDDIGVRLPGTHARQIVWIKPNIWVVVDRLEVEAGLHAYSAHWQFGPDFGPADIATSESISGTAMIRTIKPDGANVTICSAVACADQSDRPAMGVDATRYGEHDPVSGWMATHYNERIKSLDVATVWDDTETTVAIHLIVARPNAEHLIESFEAAEHGLAAKFVDGRAVRVTVTNEGWSSPPASTRDWGTLSVVYESDGAIERLVLDGQRDYHETTSGEVPIRTTNDRQIGWVST